MLEKEHYFTGGMGFLQAPGGGRPRVLQPSACTLLFLSCVTVGKWPPFSESRFLDSKKGIIAPTPWGLSHGNGTRGPVSSAQSTPALCGAPVPHLQAEATPPAPLGHWQLGKGLESYFLYGAVLACG